MNSSPCQLRGRRLSFSCVACLLLVAAPSAFAQHISVGIKAGVPLTGLLRSNYVSGRCCEEVAPPCKVVVEHVALQRLCF